LEDFVPESIHLRKSVLTAISTDVEILWKSPNGSDAVFFVLDRAGSTPQRFARPAAFMSARPQVTATLKTRAGILPKRDAMSKRKLSELKPRTHTGFTVFPQGKFHCESTG
jgi:hypothetical protein